MIVYVINGQTVTFETREKADAFLARCRRDAARQAVHGRLFAASQAQANHAREQRGNGWGGMVSFDYRARER